MPATETPVSGAACRRVNQHVDVSRGGAGRLDLTARCSALLSSGPAESAGRIVAASVMGGDFAIDPNVVYTNRLMRVEHRGRARYVPTRAVRWDLRAFLLLAGADQMTMPAATLSAAGCGADHCVTLQVGSERQVLRFTGREGHFTLSSITPG